MRRATTLLAPRLRDAPDVRGRRLGLRRCSQRRSAAARFPTPARADVTIERKRRRQGRRRRRRLSRPPPHALCRDPRRHARAHPARQDPRPHEERRHARGPGHAARRDRSAPRGSHPGRPRPAQGAADERPGADRQRSSPARRRCPSARVLIVLTIDPDGRQRAHARKYYDDVDQRPRRVPARRGVHAHRRPGAAPTRITVDRSRDGTSTKLDLTWRPAPDTPRDAFTPRGLRGASPIVW